MKSPLFEVLQTGAEIETEELAQCHAEVGVPVGVDGQGDDFGRDTVPHHSFNRGASLPWRNYLGDWHDATDTAQGDTAFATATRSAQMLGEYAAFSTLHPVKTCPSPVRRAAPTR